MVAIIKLTGSKDDGNKIENLTDASPDTRFSSQNGYIHAELDGKEFNGISLRFFKTQRKTKFSVAVSDEKFEKFEDIGVFESDGTTNGAQRFVFSKKYKNKGLRIKFVSNSDNTNWLSLSDFAVFLANEKPTPHEDNCKCPCSCDVEPKPEPQTPPRPPQPPAETTPTKPRPQPPADTTPQKPPTEVVQPPADNTLPPVVEGEIALVYPAKKNGQVVTAIKYERSKHNQSNKKNIPRDSFYSDPKNYFSATSAQLATYMNVTYKVADQVSWKILGGSHGDKNPEAGACYAIGLKITPGKETKPHIAKEIVHPNTPDFSNKAVLSGPLKQVPDLNGKTFGIRLNYWVSKKNTLVGRVDLDLSVQDKSIADLKKSNKVPNNWQTFFTFEDDGTWKNKPYITNQGLLHKDIALGFYMRLDDISKPTELAFTKAVETQVTNI